MRAQKGGFLQPHGVRIFFDGAKWFDIHWERAVVNGEIPDERFRVPDEAAGR